MSTSITLSQSWLNQDFESIKSIVEKSINNGYLPRFEKGGLPLRLECMRFIPALQQITIDLNINNEHLNSYINMGLKCMNLIEYYLYLPDEPLTEQMVNNFEDEKFQDEFGNNVLIALITAVSVEELRDKYINRYAKFVNKPGAFNDNALAHAIIICDPETVELLLKYGANKDNIVAFGAKCIDWLNAVSKLKGYYLHDEKVEKIRKLLQ